MERKYSADRETLVKFVKESAEYILDNADDLVGNNRSMRGIDITISVDVNTVPEVKLKRRYVTAGWSQKKLWVYGQGACEDDDDNGTTEHDKADEGDISV